MEQSGISEEVGSNGVVGLGETLAMAVGLWAGMLTSIGLGYVTLRAIAGL